MLLKFKNLFAKHSKRNERGCFFSVNVVFLIKRYWMVELMTNMHPVLYKEDERLDTRVGYKINRFFKDDNDLILHTHDYYEILFLPNDDCTHLVNGTEQHLPKRSLIFIRPGDCHDLINPDGKPIEIIHLGISSSIIDKLFDYLSPDFPSDFLLSESAPPFVILNYFEVNVYMDLLRELDLIDFENKSLKSVVMREKLVSIFVKFFFNKNNFSPSKTNIPEWLLKTYDEMKKLENFSQGIERMVEISGCTKEHLCRSFKKYMGCTAMSYINDLRITYIANMLSCSSKSIIELCYDSGFKNLSWMYSLFKKKYGVSPLQFRKTNQ